MVCLLSTLTVVPLYHAPIDTWDSLDQCLFVSKCVPFCVCVSVGGLWCSSCRETLMSPVINSLSSQRRVTGGLCGSSTRCRGSCFVKSVHCYIYKLPLCVVSPETPTIQSTKQPQTRVKGRWDLANLSWAQPTNSAAHHTHACSLQMWEHLKGK